MPTDTTGNRALSLICEHCGEVFGPADARGIAVFGPGYARYGCPACPWTVRSVPPPTATWPEDPDDTLTPAIVPVTD